MQQTRTLEKVVIQEQVPGSSTAHLQPVIDFLKSLGNSPSTGDAFWFDRDGFGTYGFAEPIDTAAVQAHFEFPATIRVTSRSIADDRNIISIAQNFGPNGPIV